MSMEAVSKTTKDPRTSRLTKAVGILNPIDAMRSLGRRGVDINIVKHNVGCIHNVNGPKLWLHYVEIAYVNITNVPKHKWHRAAWTSCTDSSAIGLVSLVVVPDLTVAVDTAGAVAIDPNVVSGQDESSCVVLKFDMVGIVTPVVEIFGEL